MYRLHNPNHGYRNVSREPGIKHTIPHAPKGCIADRDSGLDIISFLKKRKHSFSTSVRRNDALSVSENTAPGIGGEQILIPERKNGLVCHPHSRQVQSRRLKNASKRLKKASNLVHRLHIRISSKGAVSRNTELHCK